MKQKCSRKLSVVLANGGKEEKCELMNVDVNDPGLKVSLQIPEEEEKMFSSKYSILCLSAQKYLQLLVKPLNT